jgi:hypothetical protein
MEDRLPAIICCDKDNRFLAVVRNSAGQWRLLSYEPTPVK